MSTIHKYPRTPHLDGSRYQPGDEELSSFGFDMLKGRFIVVEEKVDGANAGISFTADGQLQLQSRGHFLIGGGRERHFNLFKTWANSHQQELWEILKDRYVLYGEWLYAKHTVFYDQLPHYFLEFDIMDAEDGSFLSTEKRWELLKGSPVVSVPVLWKGNAGADNSPVKFLRNSLYKSAEWKLRLEEACAVNNARVEITIAQTDPSDLMEGLYIKVEENDRVVERYKFIRGSFLTAVVDSETHWLDRPIVPNRLCDGVDIFARQ
jgi:hypothetical protein